MIKFKLSLFALLFLFCVTGCMETNSLNEEKKEEMVKGNCEIFECMKQINPENSVLEIDEIIGFEGILKNKNPKTYSWELTSTNSIEVSYSNQNEGSISINFDRKSQANANVDFSSYLEIKNMLESGEVLTYKRFVEMLGNVEGILTMKTTSSKQYEWINKYNQVLKATFNDETGYCTFVTLSYL